MGLLAIKVFLFVFGNVTAQFRHLDLALGVIRLMVCFSDTSSGRPINSLGFDKVDVFI